MLRYCFCFFTLLGLVISFCLFIQQIFDKHTALPISPYFVSPPPQQSDSSCTLANVIKRREVNPDRVTLVLHASGDRVDDELIEQVENWDAPVSLAVAFYDEDGIQNIGCVSAFLRNLKALNSKVDKFLSVHFLVEKSKVDCGRMAIKAVEDCSNPFHQKLKLTNRELALKLSKYPINKARNLGRQFATTKFILVADLGHYFSLNFERKIRALANLRLYGNPKTALVYRIFETKANVTQPKTKEDLRKLMKTNGAFEFHHEISKDHAIQRLHEWFDVPENPETAEIQFFKKYTSPRWEPQFVSLPTIPLFDTGFRYPRRDNTVLRWEMCRAGYQFAIVTDVFAYHKGLKDPQEMNLLNRIRIRLGKSTTDALDKFTARMDLQYPNTSDKCPQLKARYKKEATI